MELRWNGDRKNDELNSRRNGTRKKYSTVFRSVPSIQSRSIELKAFNDIFVENHRVLAACDADKNKQTWLSIVRKRTLQCEPTDAFPFR